MTKALYCDLCGTVRTFRRDTGVTSCECGAVCGWWVDPLNGIARLYAFDEYGREAGRVIGLHNGFLRAELDQSSDSDGEHRANHRIAVSAPGYLFDASRRACWAVVIRPGESSDTAWASVEEYAAKSTFDVIRRRPPVPPAERDPGRTITDTGMRTTVASPEGFTREDIV